MTGTDLGDHLGSQLYTPTKALERGREKVSADSIDLLSGPLMTFFGRVLLAAWNQTGPRQHGHQQPCVHRMVKTHGH